MKIIQDSLVNDWLVTLMDSEGKGEPWEITPFGGNLYQIRSKSNCNADTPLHSNSSTTCNAILSHRNGFAEVGNDMASYWNIIPVETGGTHGWIITSANVGEFQNQELSFDQGMDNMFLKLRDNFVTWDLQLDENFIESQNMDHVDFDLKGIRVISEENITLTSNEIHNQADFDVEGDVSLNYDLSEGNKFMERTGIALPLVTNIIVPDLIYTGEAMVLTSKVVYTIPWRTEARKIVPIKVVTKVKVPAKSYRMISVDAIRNVLSLPFRGLMRRKFNTGKESASQINGILITEQIRDIMQNIGNPLSLNETMIQMTNLMGQMQKLDDMMSDMPHSPEMIQQADNMNDQMSNDGHRNMPANNTMENVDQLSSLTHNSEDEANEIENPLSRKRRYL